MTEEERNPTSFFERVYLITGGLAGAATVAGPINPEIKAQDNLLAFDNRTKVQYVGRVVEVFPDGSAAIELQ